MDEIKTQVFEGMAAARTLTGLSGRVSYFLSLLFGLFFLYTTYFGIISHQSHIGVYVIGTFIFCLLLYRSRKGSPENRPSVFDGIMILGLIILLVYYLIEFPALADRIGGGVQTIDVILGWFLILLSLEVARRVTGKVIPMIAAVLLLYAYFGPWFPLGLSHAGFSLSRIAEFLFLTGDGILGLIANVFATFILIFVIYGAFLQVSGCGKVFVDLAYAITGKLTGGPGLASVITSASFGTVSGSAVANVAVDGVITIPLMKRLGYPSHFAGAVEASASTGGQLMPPVMGAAVFLLAEMTGTPYIEVIKIAAIPACLYFASVGVMIYLEAVKRNLRGLPSSELPQAKEIIKEIHLLLPIPILIFFLVLGYTPFLAAFYSIGACIAVSWLRKETRMGPAKIIEAVVTGVRSTLSVGATVGVIGIVIGVTNLTGLANYFQQFVTSLSGGHLFLLLLLLTVAAIFIGMGLPTTAAYIVLVILGVPAMIQLGVAPVTAHLVAFWLSVQSNVTPPVALAAWAAAAIAKSDPWKTGWTAAKLASWIYIMPFLFIYTPILNVGWNLGFISTVVACVVSLIAWGGAVEGYLLRKTMIWERIALFLAVAVLLHASLATDMIGYLLLTVVLSFQYLSRRRMNLTP